MAHLTNVCNIIRLVFVSHAVLLCSKTCKGHEICPPNSLYLENRNGCVFFLENCGDFSYAGQQCRNEDAILVSSITNDTHFHELCQFAKTRLPYESTFYLGAYRNTKRNAFIWRSNNNEVKFLTNWKGKDKGNDCLEMVVSESKCFLNDAPCSKRTWPLCEFPHANPCVYNKGGCEWECIPRHRGNRKCVCPPDQIAVGDKCLTKENKTYEECPPPFKKITKEDNCIWINKKVGSFDDHHKWCKNSLLNQSKIQNEPRLLQLASLTSLASYCPLIKTRAGAALGGNYFPGNKPLSHAGNKIIPESWLCGGSYNKYNDLEKFCLALAASDGCCLEPITCIKIIRYGICHLTLKQDSCHRDSGGCHHECVKLSNGNRECQCWEGFDVVNITECRYKDKCMVHVGEPGCPEPRKLVLDVSACVTNDTGLDNTQPGKFGESRFIVPSLAVLVACLVVLVCCVVKRRRRETEIQS